jgi:hypothetical protein
MKRRRMKMSNQFIIYRWSQGNRIPLASGRTKKEALKSLQKTKFKDKPVDWKSEYKVPNRSGSTTEMTFGFIDEN